MREVFLFFSFCKTEYRMVYGNSGVSTLSISLTNLNQITNK